MTASSSSRLIVIVCIIFLAAGLSTGAIGPLLQELARQSGADEAGAGGMVTAIFATSLLAQVTVALLQRRVGQGPILVVGMILSMAGIAGIILATSLPMLIAAAALKGLGDSGMLLIGNVVAAEAGKGAGALNLVNGMFGVGAILSPALVGLAMIHTGTGVAALWTAPIALVLALALVLIWRPGSSTRTTAQHDTKVPVGALLRTGMIWKVTLFVMLEVAAEVGISSWMPTMLTKATPLDAPAAALAMSMYWFLVTASRFGAVWVSKHLSPLAMLAIGLALCLAGGAVLMAGLVSGHAGLSVAAVAVLGVAIGPLLPTSLAILRQAYGADAGLATGVAFGSSNLGAASVPPVMGALVVASGAAAGAATLFVPILGMSAALYAISRDPRGRPAPVKPVS